ncbi:MAG TPA: PIN domain-containing protein [Chloroflexota bacterium]|nr:PIN domain-containing protein [Chloroflexota bacterium]
MRFVDTSFWYSVQEHRDRNHFEAASLARSQRGKLITSNHVVGETWTLVRRRAGHDAAVGFLDRMARLPRLDVVHVGGELEDEAMQWLRRHDEREYSFVDATSFAVMRHRKIREALAFDGDFNAAGFVEVRLG